MTEDSSGSGKSIDELQETETLDLTWSVDPLKCWPIGLVYVEAGMWAVTFGGAIWSQDNGAARTFGTAGQAAQIGQAWLSEAKLENVWTESDGQWAEAVSGPEVGCDLGGGQRRVLTIGGWGTAALHAHRVRPRKVREFEQSLKAAAERHAGALEILAEND